MEKTLSISFVLPMYNESCNIADTIHLIKDIAGELTEEYEIIIVDDASTDGSADIVDKEAENDSTIKSLKMEKNSKFGGAFAKGFKAARKDVILYMDSDMPVNTEDIKASFPLIENAHIVTGYSRVKKGDNFRRKFISGVYNFMVETLFGLKINDINSGYKIVKRELVDDIQFHSRSPFVDVELFLQAKRKNSKVIQYPLVFRSRPGGVSYISRFPIIWATFMDMLKLKIISCIKKPGKD